MTDRGRGESVVALRMPAGDPGEEERKETEKVFRVQKCRLSNQGRLPAPEGPTWHVFPR